MYLLHLTWCQEENVNNYGKLYLWCESQQINSMEGKHPYHLPEKALKAFVKSNFKIELLTSARLKLMVPCNQKSQVVPAPVVVSVHDIKDVTVTQLIEKEIDALVLEAPLAFLKSLNSNSRYFDDDLLLADDVKFWIMVARLISKALRADQYVPDIVAVKLQKELVFKSRWHPLSQTYNKAMKELSRLMPYPACQLVNADAYRVIRHFSECVISQLIWRTNFPQKHLKQVEDTLVESIIKGQEINDIGLRQWQLWQNWRKNIDYEQYGVPFILVFRLNAENKVQTSWSLTALIQSKKDQDFMVPVSEYMCNREAHKDFYQLRLGVSIEKELLLQLGEACQVYSPIERLFLKEPEQTEISLSKTEALRFLKEDACRLHACGCRVIVPAWWQDKGGLKVSVKINASLSLKERKTSNETIKSYLGYKQVVDFNYHYAIGKQEVTPQEWQVLLDEKSPLVFLKTVGSK